MRNPGRQCHEVRGAGLWDEFERARAYDRMMQQDKRIALLAVGEVGGGGHYLECNNIVEWRSHPKSERPDIRV